MDGRPAVPVRLQRELEVEAGHRCAIPTCRQTPVHLHHIIPWSMVLEHSYENMIALCPTCHARVHKGEIDRQALGIYKANLQKISGRYCDFEMRLLQHFVDTGETERWIEYSNELLIMYLLRDGLLERTKHQSPMSMRNNPYETLFSLTGQGREFITRWCQGKAVE